jgi:GNAT superfamily N-acetyltransferase
VTEPIDPIDPADPSGPADPAVRLAGVADADVVAQLLHDFNTEFESATPGAAVLAERLRAHLAGDDLFVVLAGDPPAGFGLVTLRPSPWYDGPVALLDELYVVPDRRGGGIGSALLERACTESRERQAGELQINVDEVDVDARRFYERHGFTNLGDDGRMLFYEREL